MAKPIKYLNALEPGSRLEEYEILGVLGSGGFGVTYRGNDRLLGKTVAIKEYLPNDLAVRSGLRQILPKSSADRDDFDWGLERFLEEARALASFDHPNIIRVHRFFRANGTGYIVMDYAEGETLRDLLERKRVLAPKRLKALLFPLLDGLQEMHGKGFLHRDIKPGNIVVQKKDGSPVLIDFGAARQAINTKSRSVTAIVTPGYAPIEQYSTRGAQGPETDIYALAAVAYRAIVGKRPDDATNRLSDDRLDGWAGKVSGWDRDFLEAVNKGLAFKKEHRPHSVVDWRETLGAHGIVDKNPIAKSARRSAGIRWAASVAGLAILLSLSAYLFPWENVQKSDEAQAGLSDSQSSDTARQEVVVQPGTMEPLSDEVPAVDGSETVVGVERPNTTQSHATQVENLLSEANSKFAQDLLTTPEGNNAAEDFREVLELDPGNVVALDGLAAIERRYVDLIGSALQQNNVGTAKTLLKSLLDLNPIHPGASRLESEIREVELRQSEQPPSEGISGGAESAEPETPTETVLGEEDREQNSVEDSCREAQRFERDQYGRYPDLYYQKVSECLRQRASGQE